MWCWKWWILSVIIPTHFVFHCVSVLSLSVPYRLSTRLLVPLPLPWQQSAAPASPLSIMFEERERVSKGETHRNAERESDVVEWRIKATRSLQRRTRMKPTESRSTPNHSGPPLCVCVSESIKMRLKRVVVSKSCSSCDSLRPKFTHQLNQIQTRSIVKVCGRCCPGCQCYSSSSFGLWSSLFLRYSPRSCSKPKISNTMEGKAVCHYMLQKKEKFTSRSHWQDLTQVTSYQPVST